jgi:glycosyltransferase involved in cell wall biosynthesis
MTDPTFTILMPVVRPPELMPFAIDSVLKQTRDDFELFIISDGAPPETIAAGEAASRQDGRIRVFSFPKGQRLGEAHRHTALEQARGRYVCQLADDDLWFPEHLELMAALLADLEFGHLLHINVSTDDIPFTVLTDLSGPGIRAKMLAEIFNFFGPSNAGYRMETYRRLPDGWSPAAPDVPTDLNMWRKFLALPGIVAGTGFVVSSIHFPTDRRRDWTLAQRREEIARYSGIIATAQGRERLCERSLREGARQEAARHWSWRVTAPLRTVARLVLGRP